MPFIEDLGQQAATGLLGAGMGLMLQRSNDRRQYNQQERLQGLQIRGNQQMMDYAYQKQMDMWNATNYAAQVAHMKAAGLSPGLIYGMKGGGGITTGSPAGNVQGANAPVGGGEIPSMMGMGLQLQLLKAQKENIEADTLKKKTEATKTGGVDTTLTETQTKSLAEGILNQRAQRKLTELQADLADIDKEIKGRTIEEAIELIDWETQRAANEVERLFRQNIIDKATMNDRIDMVKAELAKTWAIKYLTDAQTTTEEGKPAIQSAEINLMGRQAYTLAQQGEQRWRELELQGANVEQGRQRLNEEIFKTSNMPPQLVNDLIDLIILKKITEPAKRVKQAVDPRFKTHWKTDVGNIK